MNVPGNRTGKSCRYLLLAGIAAGLAAQRGVTAAEREVTAPRGYTLPAGTRITVRLGQALDTHRDRPGRGFMAHVAAAVVRDGQAVIPRGAVCRGHVMESRPSGRLRGRAVLQLSLDSVEVGGRSYALRTSGATYTSKSHKTRNLALIGGGAGTGASIGAIAGGGVGALIGAGAGAAAGTTGAVITGKRNLRLAPETRLTFSLRAPVNVR
jgi:hypothetical protein